MPFNLKVSTTGFKELERYLQRLPAAAALRLQAVEIKNHLEHRAEIVKRSTFSPQGTRNIKRAIKVHPSRRTEPKTIQAVEAGTSSFWRGIGVENPNEGVAAIVEKSVGQSKIKPRHKRFLILPFGDFLTPGGRPRRQRRDVGGRSVMAPVLIRDLPGTRVVNVRNKLRVIQRLEPGQRGKFESGAKGVRKGRLGVRERIVATLVKSARVVRGLDFFGSFGALEKKRLDRYSRMLQDVLNIKV